MVQGIAQVVKRNHHFLIISANDVQSYSILCTSNHLSQFVLAGEVCLKSIQVLNDVLGAGQDCLLRCNFAVSLDSKLELGEKWMRDLGELATELKCPCECTTYAIRCEGDVAVLQELVAK